MFIIVSSPKGGSGTSVVSAGLAALLSTSMVDRDRKSTTRLVDLGGDQPAILGIATTPHGLAEWSADPDGRRLIDLVVPVTDDLGLIPRGAGPFTASTATTMSTPLHHLALESHVIVDAGLAELPESITAAADLRLMVVQPCYLSLRRAVHDSRTADGVIVVRPANRVLTDRDVQNVLSVPVVASLPIDDDVARRVDSGLLHSRLPDVLRRALEPLISSSRRTPT